MSTVFPFSFPKGCSLPGIAVWAFLAGWVYAFLAAPLPDSTVAQASCGDWLQHSNTDSDEAADPVKPATPEQTPEDSPQCHGPGCRQAPVVPATTGFQTVEDLRPRVDVASQLDPHALGRGKITRFAISDDRNALDGHRQRTDRPPNR